jgi:hypothetical protein
MQAHNERTVESSTQLVVVAFESSSRIAEEKQSPAFSEVGYRHHRCLRLPESNHHTQHWQDLEVKSSMASQTLIDQVKRIIPPLTAKLHKGQAGRIGVVGGSAEYVELDVNNLTLS